LETETSGPWKKVKGQTGPLHSRKPTVPPETKKRQKRGSNSAQNSTKHSREREQPEKPEKSAQTKSENHGKRNPQGVKKKKMLKENLPQRVA